MSELPDESIPTRHSLLNRLKDWQDEASWRQFFETYWRLIHNFALKSGLTSTEAEDVVQETVLGVAKRIEKFKTGAGHGSFKSWLMQQTYWRIQDQFRRRRKDRRATVAPAASNSFDSEQSSGTDPKVESVDPELHKIWEIEWQEHVARTALERVKAASSVKQFQMFDLHELQGISVGETAQALGVSRAAVYMACSRLKRLLRREIKSLLQPPL
jgi:RNA polymerase sigma factor (sigma-70 family)